MFDFDALLSLSIVALGIAGWAAFLRLVSGREPVNLAALFGRPWELSWPRGVQEEEPVPWRVELAHRPGHGAVTPPRPATVARPEPDAASGPEAAACDCATEDAAA